MKPKLFWMAKDTIIQHSYLPSSHNNSSLSSEPFQFHVTNASTILSSPHPPKTRWGSSHQGSEITCLKDRSVSEFISEFPKTNWPWSLGHAWCFHQVWPRANRGPVATYLNIWKLECRLTEWSVKNALTSNLDKNISLTTRSARLEFRAFGLLQLPHPESSSSASGSAPSLLATP